MKRLLIYLLLGFSILPSWAVPSGPLQLHRGGESKHPGLLHSQSSIERMQRLFEEQNPVAMGSYMKLVNDAKSRADYAMRGPFDIIAPLRIAMALLFYAMPLRCNPILYLCNSKLSHAAAGLFITS